MIELLILAVALSMDAFAVSLGLGAKQAYFNKHLALKAGLFFGFFQGFMPLIGYLAGMGLSGFIEAVDQDVEIGEDRDEERGHDHGKGLPPPLSIIAARVAPVVGQFAIREVAPQQEGLPR